MVAVRVVNRDQSDLEIWWELVVILRLACLIKISSPENYPSTLFMKEKRVHPEMAYRPLALHLFFIENDELRVALDEQRRRFRSTVERDITATFDLFHFLQIPRVEDLAVALCHTCARQDAWVLRLRGAEVVDRDQLTPPDDEERMARPMLHIRRPLHAEAHDAHHWLLDGPFLRCGADLTPLFREDALAPRAPSSHRIPSGRVPSQMSTHARQLVAVPPRGRQLAVRPRPRHAAGQQAEAHTRALAWWQPHTA
mmetsp:Transcript_19606/g.45046  ORF Transcript_19606/g.45046 Transcript_19606/m.45046 type:complete len:254 (+) Transcript_19606:583-1344(+)